MIQTECRQDPFPHILLVGGNHRGPPSFKVLEEHAGLKILLKPVLENTICYVSFKLFKPSEQLYNTNVKILFGSLNF